MSMVHLLMKLLLLLFSHLRFHYSLSKRQLNLPSSYREMNISMKEFFYPFSTFHRHTHEHFRCLFFLCHCQCVTHKFTLWWIVSEDLTNVAHHFHLDSAVFNLRIIQIEIIVTNWRHRSCHSQFNSFTNRNITQISIGYSVMLPISDSLSSHFILSFWLSISIFL